MEQDKESPMYLDKQGQWQVKQDSLDDSRLCASLAGAKGYFLPCP